MTSYLYGLERASHDFSDASSLGKNIFTNAAPLSMAQYLAIEKKLPLPLIEAVIHPGGTLSTKHTMTPWSEIIGTNPLQARFQFEGVFDGYGRYTHGTANKSDVVVIDNITGQHLRPLEIKLVVVPTSSTADYPREQQSCEIVTRPPTIEQLAFSIAHSYGEVRRIELQEIIRKAIGQPNDLDWSDQSRMIKEAPKILTAAETMVAEGIDVQTPLVMTAIWRSKGQKPVLDQEAFDVFVWTDLAFIQLFMESLRKEYFDGKGHRKPNLPTKVSRPSRSLIWLMKSLWDYTTQGSLDFGRVHSLVTYGAQSDKAAAFSGKLPLKYLKSEEFFHPRIGRDELEQIIQPEAFNFLLPERRLDAALAIQHLVNQQKEEQQHKGSHSKR